MRDAEAELDRVDVVGHRPPPDVAAREVVGPLVVRAHQPATGPTVGLLADDRAAVPANVVQRPQLTVAAPDDDEREVPYLQGQVVARLGDFADVAGEHPLSVPHVGEVQLEDVGVVVHRPRQRPSEPPPFQQVKHTGRLHALS